MKKIMVVLALLIAAPAFALTVDCNDLGGGVVAIQYSDADVNNLPAAFGLSITADSGATLTLKSGSFKTGESTSASRGYGIFPGSINLTDPNNPVWNNPAADPCDEPAGDADGTGFVIVELGALYDDDSNAPLTSGTLCEFDVSANCTVTVQSEATYRAGVVLESGATVTVDSNCTMQVVTDCYTGAKATDWANVGKPDCWCTENNPRQCHGDADGASQGFGQYWVSTFDLDILIDAWSKPYSSMVGQTTHDIPWICADFARDAQGFGQYRVSTNDLDILITYWQISQKPDPNCIED